MNTEHQGLHEVTRALIHKIRTPLSVITNELSYLSKLVPEGESERAVRATKAIAEILKNPDTEIVPMPTRAPGPLLTEQHGENSILVVDDQSDAAVSLMRGLKGLGILSSFQIAGCAEQALKIAALQRPPVVILDLSLEDGRGVEGGFDLLQRLLHLDPSMRIVVLTGHGASEYGVRAMLLGAANFAVKPADLGHLAALILDGFSQAALRREYQALRERSASDISAQLCAQSSVMRDVVGRLEYAARTNQAVFLSGETGTGKGVCAGLIHRFSARAAREFVRYQPHLGGADIVSSDLFGHKRGAFTGAERDRTGLIAAAAEGTLFLDEIDELPPETQVALLGVLNDKRFRPLGSNQECRADFRLICASNRLLESQIAEGKFRRDLFHRIAHIRIVLPPLRERLEDLPLLSTRLLESLREHEGIRVSMIDQGALQKLSAYNWPGNVRELHVVLEGAAYRAQFAERSIVSADDIEFGSLSAQATALKFRDRVRNYERSIVREAIARNQGNQLRAAKDLGIDRGTLKRILEI